MALFERELEEQRMKAAIARAINSPMYSTVESVGADTARAGMTAGTTSAFANDLDARIDAEAMAKTFAGQESNIASQRAMAQSLRDRGMPEAKMVGQGNWATLQQPNWGETLEGVVNKLTGGYLEGQARQNATQLDVDQTKQAGLAKAAEEEIRLDELALEDKRFNIGQGNFESEADALVKSAALKAKNDVEAARLLAQAQKAKLSNLTIVDIDGKNPRNIVQGQEIPEGAILASSWIDRNTSEAAMIDAFGGNPPLTQEELDLLSPAQIDSIGRRKIIEKFGSAGERDRANLLVNAAGEFQRLLPVGQQMIEDGTGYKVMKQAFGPASKLLVPEKMEAVISNMVIEKTYTPEQMQWLGGIANAFADLRKARTGANVTEIEVELQSLFDPSVTGLTVEQRTRRLSDILNTVNTELENIGLKGFDVVEIEGKNNSAEVEGEKAVEEMTDAELEAELNG